MKFTPMTEQEARDAATLPPLPDGDYDCETTVVVEGPSKSSGLNMFDIEIKVFTPEGRVRTLHDYVMTEGKAAWRLRECCVALGVLAQYEAGEVSAFDLENRTFRATLSTDPATEKYAAKNRIRKYLAPNGQAAPRRREPVATGPNLDDDIPF